MAAKNNKPVLVKAVDYLSIRDHSIKQLSDKLRRCGYAQKEIEAAISKLLQNGYLNDTDLCRRQVIRYLNENRYSILAIKHKLCLNGFSSETISECMTQDLDEYEEQAAYNILKNRYKRSADSGKYIQYLYRKGFSSKSIRYAADKFSISDYI